MKRSVISTALCVAAIALMPGAAQSQESQQVEKKGTAPYVTHFIFRPVETLEIPGVGTDQLYEMTGSTQNLKGEPMLDKMAARCTAILFICPNIARAFQSASAQALKSTI
jgi:hypothetical protein